MGEEVSSDVYYLLNQLKQINEYENDQLKISYGDLFIDGEKNLTKEQTINPPNIQINNSNSLFKTLVMIDPDAPSSNAPITGPFIHWIKDNFEENDGQDICEYMGPSPRSGTGTHRYIFLLYQSNKKVEENQTFEDIPKRRKFPLENFVSKNELQLICIKFFTVQA